MPDTKEGTRGGREYSLRISCESSADLCACGDPIDVHPTLECGFPHRPEEFDAAGHAQRVAANFPNDTVEHFVALYHDHLEDKIGPVPAEYLAHVKVLTRLDEDYKTYIRSIKHSGDRVAINVKLADARDNLARCQGKHDGYVNSNLARRYEYVLKELGGA